MLKFNTDGKICWHVKKDNPDRWETRRQMGEPPAFKRTGTEAGATEYSDK